MSNLFVLVEIGWEYNDEVYFRSESGGGMPKKVFECENAAKLECNRLNALHMKKLFESGNVRDYCYSLEDKIIYSLRKDKKVRSKLDETCQSIFGYSFSELSDKINDSDKIEVLNSATDEDWHRFMSVTYFLFWEVIPVKKG